jgi:hypothetical protein
MEIGGYTLPVVMKSLHLSDIGQRVFLILWITTQIMYNGGGYTTSLPGNPSPPMGNGHWPGENSSTFQDMRYIKEDETSYPPVPMPGVESYVSHKDCYQVSRLMTDKFSYGGPGGCTK